MNSIYKNFKVTKIEIKSNSRFSTAIDSDNLHFRTNQTQYLKIEKYMVNDKYVDVPIATFIPIQE